MMVTFVSQCEHKALNRTRRVLDAFANRIGSRTWQTVVSIDKINNERIVPVNWTQKDIMKHKGEMVGITYL